MGEKIPVTLFNEYTNVAIIVLVVIMLLKQIADFIDRVLTKRKTTETEMGKQDQDQHAPGVAVPCRDLIRLQRDWDVAWQEIREFMLQQTRELATIKGQVENLEQLVMTSIRRKAPIKKAR